MRLLMLVLMVGYLGAMDEKSNPIVLPLDFVKAYAENEHNRSSRSPNRSPRLTIYEEDSPHGTHRQVIEFSDDNKEEEDDEAICCTPKVQIALGIAAISAVTTIVGAAITATVTLIIALTQ